MAIKTIAERLYEAYLTGTEATFYSDGMTYTFTPEGLASYISTEIPPVPELPDVSESAEPETLVVRDEAGAVYTSYATEGGHAVTLDQLNEKVPDTDGVTVGFALKVGAGGVPGWAADTNTTYTIGTAAEMTTGTVATGRLFNATTFPAVLGAALARNTAIAALTPESSLEDVIAALKAG